VSEIKNAPIFFYAYALFNGIVRCLVNGQISQGVRITTMKNALAVFITPYDIIVRAIEKYKYTCAAIISSKHCHWATYKLLINTIF